MQVKVVTVKKNVKNMQNINHSLGEYFWHKREGKLINLVLLYVLILPCYLYYGNPHFWQNFNKCKFPIFTITMSLECHTMRTSFRSQYNELFTNGHVTRAILRPLNLLRTGVH